MFFNTKQKIQLHTSEFRFLRRAQLFSHHETHFIVFCQKPPLLWSICTLSPQRNMSPTCPALSTPPLAHIFHFFPLIHFLTCCLPFLGPYSASDWLTPNQSSVLMPSTNLLNERQQVPANQMQSRAGTALLSQEEKSNLGATGCKQFKIL